MKMSINVPLMMALAAALAASPGVAQKSGHGHGRGSERVERRDDDRDGNRRVEHGRFERRGSRTQQAGRGDNGNHKGWCQGRGNPHNTVENCGYTGSRADRDGRTGTYGRDGVYYPNRTSSRNGTLNGASYDQAHRAYHDQHDRQCSAAANQRPTDLQRQLRVRSQCRTEHTQWHERYDANRR